MTGAATFPSGGGPDWAAVLHDVQCPLCEYNLRGLANNRCPECGFVFAWDDVLDAKRRKHPYLFEHHPERNFGSFADTVIGGLLPLQFWTTLHPVQPARRLRLLAYAAVVEAAVALPLGLGYLLGVPGGNQSLDLSVDYVRWGGSMVGLAVLDFVEQDVHDLVLQVPMALVAVPVATLLVLLVFQSSMRRARVRLHHVARCVVYSADVVLVPGLVVAGMVVINATPVNAGMLAHYIGWTLVCALPLLWLVFAWRLTQAYRRYLRFPHAVAAVAASQFIVLLLVLIAGCFLDLRF